MDLQVQPVLDALRNFDALPDSAEVRQPVVEGLFAISAATVWRWVHAGHLPMPHKFGPRTTTWNVGALRAAQRARVSPSNKVDP